MPSVSLAVDQYWESMEDSIKAAEKKGEKLFTDEEFFKILITTIARQRLKFKEKGCSIQ